MRSAIVSLSSCEKTEAMYIIARPMGVPVSNCSLIETKAISSLLSSSIKPEKSLMFRLMRSNRYTTTALNFRSRAARSIRLNAGRSRFPPEKPSSS